TQVAFLQRRADAGGAALVVPPASAAGVRARLEAAFGFALTASQRRALDEIAVDLGGPAPMQRLLVGDVGSGKTAVALGAAALVAAAGGQTAMMVPTEVLAEQQARALHPIAARMGLRVVSLTGATTGAARAALLEGAGVGPAALLVGTQAVLDAAGRLPRLAVAIVDEEDRLGVGVRAALACGDGEGAGLS